MTSIRSKHDASLTEITVAGGAAGFNWLPVFAAEEQGLFEKNGLRFTFKRMGGVDKATAAVLEGEADLAITPPEGAVADYVKGGELRIIGSNANRLPMSLVAHPRIRTFADLKGKKIGTSSLTEGTAIYTQVMLAQHGLRYPGDYEFALAGIHTARWTALQAGEIDAAPQPAPWNFLAEDAGYSNLGEVSDAIPEILFTAVIGKVSWLERNSDLVTRFLKALVEAHERTNDVANDAVNLPIFQRITTPDDAGLARRGLTYMRDLGMWPEKLAIPESALDTTIDLMVKAGLLDSAKRDAARGVFDSSFLERATG